MRWETLYVTGRSGFTSELVDGLNNSGEDFLTGSYDENGVYLFWVTEHFALKKLKIVLGYKMIFRYRLRFFSDIDTFTLFTQKNYSNNLTPEQEQTFRDFYQIL